EVGRAVASRGRGVVRDPGEHRSSLRRVATALEGCGATIIGAMASPVVGPAGNVEFLLHARAHGDRPAVESAGGPAATGVDDMIERALAETPRPGAEAAP
ncbi:MAG TPA: hypothetical protein VMU09_03970, partial [Acidimicrobiales bacterium]|nr:hypothetical protein [Acidimicrobiales bacterium]